MDHFKVENFQRDNPGASFPVCESLSLEKCSLMRSHIAEQVGLSTAIDALDLVKKLNELATDVGRFDPGSTLPNLSRALQGLKIEPLEQIYINWHRYDVIDKMAFADLQLHFESIWYPAADDIDIFDDTLKWILSVTHYGIIRALILENRKGKGVSQ